MKDEKLNRNKTSRRKRVKAREVTEVRKDTDFDKSPRTNDLSWYTLNDQLLRDAGSLSFNNPLGNSTRLSELSQFGPNTTYGPNAVLDRPVPGLMAIEYVPTIGVSQNNYSPINIAARALFSMVRKTQSGKWNYEPADLMKYILALDSAYMMYAQLCRIYGTAKVYSVVNRYWPDAILKAMHVNRDDVIAHLSDLRYYINALAHRLNTLCAPSGIKLFDRHFFMNIGVWKDADFDKAQLYMYTPVFVYKYEEMNTTGVPAELVPLALDGSNATANNLYTVTDLINMTETLINSLMASEDIGVISGDLFKAYGVGNSHNVAFIDENFEIYPVYDETVLHQIHNTRFMGALSTDLSIHKITELTTQDGNAGALVQSFNIMLADDGNMIAPVHGLAHILDFDKPLESITPGDVMEATRMTAFGEVYTQGGNTTRLSMDVYGSELAITGMVYGLKNGRDVELVTILRSGSWNSSQLLTWAVSAASFNMHPMIFSTQCEQTNKIISSCQYLSNDVSPVLFDINTYTVIGKTALRKLHESALLALFNMPVSGQYQ